MDPEIVAQARREDLAFGQAVALGVSCEPPAGIPDVASVVRALNERGRDTFVIVEQDMYPVDFDVPKPIAARTRAYLRASGIGVDAEERPGGRDSS
jgi:inosose dehydratase